MVVTWAWRSFIKDKNVSFILVMKNLDPDPNPDLNPDPNPDLNPDPTPDPNPESESGSELTLNAGYGSVLRSIRIRNTAQETHKKCYVQQK